MASVIPLNHQEFIRLVAEGSEQDKAYISTIGNNDTTSKTAREQGSKLAKKYAEQIAQERQRLKDIVQQAQDEAMADRAKKRILTSIERMEILTEIATGTHKTKRPFVIGGKIMEYNEEPDLMDKIKAIAELNKMDGSYAPQKTTFTDVKGNNIPLLERMIRDAKGVELKKEDQD